MTERFFDARIAEAWTIAPREAPVPETRAKADADGDAIFRWSTRDCFAGLHPTATRLWIIDDYDPIKDQRRGWATVVRRGVDLDVEDFFVMPEFRRQGRAKKIAAGLQQLSEAEGAPLRLWAPHADCYEEGRTARDKLGSRLSLTFSACDERWAGLVGAFRTPASAPVSQTARWAAPGAPRPGATTISG